MLSAEHPIGGPEATRRKLSYRTEIRAPFVLRKLLPRSLLPLSHGNHAVFEERIQHIGVESHEAPDFVEGDSTLIHKPADEPRPYS